MVLLALLGCDVLLAPAPAEENLGGPTVVYRDEPLDGAVVVAAHEGKAAAAAGITNGDVICGIVGAAPGWQALMAHVKSTRPGDTVTLLRDRAGARDEVVVTVGSLPDGRPLLGLHATRSAPDACQGG